MDQITVCKSLTVVSSRPTLRKAAVPAVEIICIGHTMTKINFIIIGINNSVVLDILIIIDTAITSVVDPISRTHVLPIGQAA